MAKEKFQEPEIKVVRQEPEAPKQQKAEYNPPPVFIQPFDSWWMQAMSKWKLNDALKEPVRKHFQARGFLESGKYEDGLRDFGFKLP
jgi:hypothetical protein